MGVLSPPDHTTEVSPAASGAGRSPLLKREMPGLDVLRGVAILSVVAYHGLDWWLPLARSYSSAVRTLAGSAAFGWLGVNLFFLLSGFLITGILLDTRTRANYWKNFYMRRVLRIVPLYIVTLILAKLLFTYLTWAYILLCALYLANLAISFGLETYGPLWSLSVEEQFYLVWPVMVRHFKVRTLAILCVASLVLSPLMRFLTVSKILPLGDPHMHTWLMTDNLAIGALFAIFLRSRFSTVARIRALTIGSGVAGVVFLVLGLHFHQLSRVTPLGAALQPEPFFLIFASWLMLALQYGDRPMVYRLTAPLRFFGYISYGLYLLHLFVFRGYFLLVEYRRPVPEMATVRDVLVRFVLLTGIATVISYLSRRYFEEYVLRLKDRIVPYKAESDAAKAGNAG